MRDKLIALLGILALLTVVVGSFWMYYAGPCGFYSFAPASDIPGRCVMVHK